MYYTQPLRRAAQVTPEQTATIFNDRIQTHKEVADRVARLAGGLLKTGVQEGDRVAILALNSDRYYEYLFAVPWAGAVQVALNIRWSLEENLYSLNDSGATVLFVDDAFIEVAQALQEKSDLIRHYIHMGEGELPPGMLEYEQLIAATDPVADAGRGDDDLLGIFYTGGTTGFPKGVMLSHRNIYSSSLAALVGLDKNTPGIRYLHAAPMFHLADGAMLLANSIAGNTHVFIPAFNPQSVAKVIEKHQVTDVLLVPTMIALMLEQGVLTNEYANFGSLNKIIYGASPMPEGTLCSAMEMLPEVNFYQCYGQTELAPAASILRPEHHVIEGEGAGKLRAAGQAVCVCEIEIRGTNEEPLPAGEVGQVVVRGPNAMLGYWNKPDQTAETLIDGWIYTGDVGYLDAEGFLFLMDRAKDMIVTGGENVFSAEVESALSCHPAVQDVAVIGIPSSSWGESVHAIVRLKPGEEATEQALIDTCRERIAHYKCPRSIEFRIEPFPVTGAGKLRKLDLRAPYWEGVERRIN